MTLYSKITTSHIPGLTCPECGSYSVGWIQELEEFKCTECDTHFDNEDHIENYFYKLDMVDYELKEIPGWVFQRWYLKKIDLSSEPNDSWHWPFFNRIKEIPPEIKNMEYLEELNICGNNITDIPKEIGYCKNLRDLLLGNNYICYVPEEIGNLKKLEWLNLRCNKLDSLPDEIGLLSNLKILRLDNNKLTSLPESIVNLSKLEELSISGNTDLTSPPYDVAMQGIKAIREWFDLKKQDLSC